MWVEERLLTSSSKDNKFGICCLDGQIEIPLLPSPPMEIIKLLEGKDDLSKYFQQNIRAFRHLYIAKNVLFF